VFLIQGTQVDDLSAFGSGVNRFFTDHLAFEILRWFPNVDVDNHFNGVGLHGVFDSKFDRVIISKLDYIPLSKDIKYNSTTKEFYIEEIINNLVLTTVVDLKDSEYFCNKSWTLSFNVNTKTWISFHSYIPNWYIAENNFFYSGINGCCDDFDFVAGELIPTPSTTTTTTSFVPTTTTTTTTAIPLDCTMSGEVTITNCTLEGTGLITVPPIPPPCQRPTGMQTLNFITGYDIIAPPSTVVSTASQVNACAAVAYIDSQSGIEPFPITLTYIIVNVVNITIGQTVYDGLTGTDCTLIPNGWYFTDETANSGVVFNVVSGIITEIVNCNPTTTTTSTTTTPCTGLHPYNYNLIFSTTTVGDFTTSLTNACLAVDCLTIPTCGPSSLLIGWWDNVLPVIGNTVYSATIGCVTPNVDGYYVIDISGTYTVVEMLDGVIIDFPTC
jgi:hypothetical protein